MQDGISDLHTVIIPISGPYLISLGGNILNNGGKLILRRNRKEHLLDGGRTDIVDLNEDDELRVFAWAGTKVIWDFQSSVLTNKSATVPSIRVCLT